MSGEWMEARNNGSQREKYDLLKLSNQEVCESLINADDQVHKALNVAYLS